MILKGKSALVNLYVNLYNQYTVLPKSGAIRWRYFGWDQKVNMNMIIYENTDYPIFRWAKKLEESIKVKNT